MKLSICMGVEQIITQFHLWKNIFLREVQSETETKKETKEKKKKKHGKRKIKYQKLKFKPKLLSSPIKDVCIPPLTGI